MAACDDVLCLTSAILYTEHGNGPGSFSWYLRGIANARVISNSPVWSRALVNVIRSQFSVQSVFRQFQLLRINISKTFSSFIYSITPEHRPHNNTYSGDPGHLNEQ